MKKVAHQKHPKLTRPQFGNFGRIEWAIQGTSDDAIQHLAKALITALSESYTLSYVDADQIRDLNSFQARMLFNEVDVVLVNGNHYKALRQIVVIDPQEEDSLKQQLDHLTEVDLILLKEENLAIPPFLQKHLEGRDIPILLFSDISGTQTFLRQAITTALPPLYGLVLAGGKSQRMGEDKGAIHYHGKPQREYAAELLMHFCEKAFISCRPNQMKDFTIATPSLHATSPSTVHRPPSTVYRPPSTVHCPPSTVHRPPSTAHPLLPDSFLNLGPFGAIASAFREHPNVAWLVVACDLPLLDQDTLKQLVEGRNRSAVATAFNNPLTELPEPLITIWEPRAYPILMQFLTQGCLSPREVLRHSKVALLEVERAEALLNVNRPEEREGVLKRLREGRGEGMIGF